MPQYLHRPLMSGLYQWQATSTSLATTATQLNNDVTNNIIGLDCLSLSGSTLLKHNKIDRRRRQNRDAMTSYYACLSVCPSVWFFSCASDLLSSEQITIDFSHQQRRGLVSSSSPHFTLLCNRHLRNQSDSRSPIDKTSYLNECNFVIRSLCCTRTRISYNSCLCCCIRLVL